MIGLLLLLVSAFDTIQDSSIRIKRLGYYYICGVYPNEYYSIYPCDSVRPPYSQYCANGGIMLGMGCITNTQCTPFSPLPTACISGCCCTVPTEILRTTTASSLDAYGYCYNGERSQMRCSSTRECSGGQTCINGLCCKTTGQEWQNACAGLTAISSCTNGTCGSFVCTTSNYCCECQFGRTSGLCTNDRRCGPGFTCSENGYCCPSCPNGATPYGSCYNGNCAAGYSCRSGNICCP